MIPHKALILTNISRTKQLRIFLCDYCEINNFVGLYPTFSTDSNSFFFFHFSFFVFSFIFISWRLIYNIVVVFAIH